MLKGLGCLGFSLFCVVRVSGVGTGLKEPKRRCKLPVRLLRAQGLEKKTRTTIQDLYTGL